MKIGMLLPSLLMADRFKDRIFAPKSLFLSLVGSLVKRNHKVFVYSTSDTKTQAELIYGDIKLERKDLVSVRLRHDDEEYLQRMYYRATSSEYELDLTVKAFQHARENKLDVIHSYHGSIAHFISTTMSSIPVVYTLHDPPYLPNTIEGWRFDHFPNDNYLAISKHQAEGYNDRVNIVDTIYHGIDLEKFPFSLKTQNYYIFMGRFIPAKGAVEAINTAKRLSVRLEIATSSNYMETPFYKNKVKPLINSKFIKVLGFLFEEERNKWVKQAKAIFFPILWDEPFGMVMIEAMACGTPVIAFARGSVPEVIVDGKTGFIINSSDKNIRGDWIIKKTGEEGLIEAVRRLDAMNEQDYQEMRRNSRKHVQNNFSLDKMVENYERVYRQIINNK